MTCWILLGGVFSILPSSALATPISCQALFFPERSPLVIDLQRKLEAKMTAVEAMLHKQLRDLKDDFQDLGIQNFSSETQTRLREVTRRAVEDLALPDQAEFDHTTYRKTLQEILKKDPYYLHLETRQTVTSGASVLDRFIRARHSAYTLELAILDLQNQLEDFSIETKRKILKAEGSGILLDLVTGTSAFDFIYSTRSSDPFWGSIKTLNELQEFRLDFMRAMRDRHESKLSQKVVSKLALLVAKKENDVIKLLTAPSALGDASMIERIRHAIGADAHLTPQQLKIVAYNLYMGNSYEVILVSLFEDNAHKIEILKDLRISRDLIELGEALDKDDYRSYLGELSERRDRSRPSLP